VAPRRGRPRRQGSRAGPSSGGGVPVGICWTNGGNATPTALNTEDGEALPEAPSGREGSPRLTLNGFPGPLETLLTPHAAQKIELFALSLTALIDQLTATPQQASRKIPLGQMGTGW
jgi:hypothetical protein